MKVILLSDIERLGQLGDEVVVAKGYGRNYLIPQGYALLATPLNTRLFEQERVQYQMKVDALRAKASSLKEQIEGKVITISVRTGDNNKLYGSVTTQMIAESLEQENIIVDRRKILLDSPIRSVGEHPVRVRLHADIIAEFSIAVISEKSEVMFDEADEIIEEKADESIVEVKEPE